MCKNGRKGCGNDTSNKLEEHISLFLNLKKKWLTVFIVLKFTEKRPKPHKLSNAALDTKFKQKKESGRSGDSLWSSNTNLRLADDGKRLWRVALQPFVLIIWSWCEPSEAQAAVCSPGIALVGGCVLLRPSPTLPINCHGNPSSHFNFRSLEFQRASSFLPFFPSREAAFIPVMQRHQRCSRWFNWS